MKVLDLILAIVVTRSVIALAATVPDLTTPEKAGDALALAIRTGDPKAIHQVVIAPAYRDAEIVSLAEVGKATGELCIAVEKRWGDQGVEAMSLSVAEPPPPGMHWEISGEMAIMKDDTIPEMSGKYRQKRINGRWLSDWNDVSSAESARLKRQNDDELAKLKPFVASVKAGEYKTLESTTAAYDVVRSTQVPPTTSPDKPPANEFPASKTPASKTPTSEISTRKDPAGDVPPFDVKTPAEYEEHNSSLAGFSVRTPANWQPRPTLAAEDKLALVHGKTTAVLSSAPAGKDTLVSLADAINASVDPDHFKHADLATINGEPAMLTKGLLDTPGKQTAVYLCVIIKNHMQYRLRLITSPGNFDKNLLLYQKIASSLKVP